MTTTTINIVGQELECTGHFTPKEPMVMYYKDGTGYPGSPAEFEINKVVYKGRDITELLEAIDEDIFIMLEELCIDSITK